MNEETEEMSSQDQVMQDYGVGQQISRGMRPNMMETYSGAIQTLTDPSQQLHEFEMKLRGLKQIKPGEYAKVAEPLCNMDGVNSVINIISTHVSRITFLSNVDDDMIRILVLDMCNALIQDLMINREKYGMKNEATRTLILHMARTSAYVSMRRSYNEGERYFWKGSQQEITMKTQQDSQGKQGMFSKLLGWQK